MVELDFRNPSEYIWHKMFNAGISLPLSLQEQLPESFVYDRRWGVFPVEFGHHTNAMALFWALEKGFKDHWDVHPDAVPTGYSTDPDALAELWLINTKGTCYRSTLTPTVWAGRRGNLNETELDYFGQISYISLKINILAI